MAETIPPVNIEHSDSLIAYLQATRRIAPGVRPAIQVLSGGVSNRTVLVELPGGERWVLKQALSKLRVAVDWYSNPDRILREALGIQWLGRLAPSGTIPRLVFLDAANYLLAMQAVPEPHANWKALLLSGRLEEQHVDQFGQLLATIHRRSTVHAGQVAPVFEDRRFFEELRLEPYYVYTASQVPEAAGFYAELIDQTRAHRHALTHGDYSPKNMLVYEGRLVLLDHEVIHFGDPAFDLGFSLTHLLSKAHHLAHLRAAFAEAALRYWQVYSSTLGDVPWRAELEERAVRQTLGCLLARVAGRSPLEYLSAGERQRQSAAVVRLMASPPPDVPTLVDAFLARVAVPADEE